MGEDISEKLDIVPAEFFVHRRVYGKWACRWRQRLVQVIGGGMPAAGLACATFWAGFSQSISDPSDWCAPLVLV